MMAKISSWQIVEQKVQILSILMSVEKVNQEEIL